MEAKYIQKKRGKILKLYFPRPFDTAAHQSLEEIY